MGSKMPRGGVRQDNCTTSGGIPRRNGIYYCPDSDSGCNYSSKIKTCVQSHIDFRHSEEKPFSCLLCEFRCKSESAQRAHIRVHTKEKPFACKIPGCSYASAQSGHLKEHQNTVHSNSWNFTCDFPSCGFKTKLKTRLATHKKIHEPVQIRKHICPHSNCGYQGRRKEHLKNHIACMHSDERPFKCTLFWPPQSESQSGSGSAKCGYSGKTKEALKQHLKVHDKDDAGKKSCTFPGCEYKTRQSGHLNEHLRRHSGTVKKLKCGLCPRLFSGRYTLEDHERSEHSRDRENWFSCSFCDYKSARFGSLATHIRKHTKETPYKCADCGKSGYHAGFLPYHRKMHERQSRSQEQKKKRQRRKSFNNSSTFVAAIGNGEIYTCPNFSTNAKCSFSSNCLKEMALHLNQMHKLPRVEL